MTKEEKYEQELKALGIWEPAFKSTVHDLAILEREQARTRKAWKDTAKDGEAPSPLDPHYNLILRQNKMIQTLRESLGLTPKALRRIRMEFGQEPGKENPEKPKTVLELLQEKKRASG